MKKLLSVLLAALICFGMLSEVLADTESLPEVSAESFKDPTDSMYGIFSAETIVSGDTVQVAVHLHGVYEFHGLSMYVDYDPDALTFISYSRGNITENLPVGGNALLRLNCDGRFSAGVMCPYDGVTDTGDIVFLTFTAAPNASSVGYGIVCSIDCFFYLAGTSTQYDIPYTVKYGNDNDAYRVSFIDSFNGSSTVYQRQEVQANQYAAKPADPSHQGYVFGGWYSNPECTGKPWFDNTNGYHGKKITANTNLYAKWEESSFEISQDWYSFNNTDEDFWSGWFCPLEKQFITGEYYHALLEACGTKTLPKLLINLMMPWGGSCFGMSAAAALFKAGKLDTEFFQNMNNTSVHLLESPNENNAVRNLISYYMWIQLSPTTETARKSSNIESDNCKRIIEALESSNYPVVIGFDDYEKKASGNGYRKELSHAVLAYSYTAADGTYTIKIADPNGSGYPTASTVPSYLTIKKNGDTYENRGFSGMFGSLYDEEGQRYSFLKYGLTVESNAYDFQNIQDYLIGKGYSSGSTARSADEIEDITTLTTNFDCFRIEASSGAYATIEDGCIIGGDLEISECECINDADYELQLQFSLPEIEADESYSVIPAESISTISDEPIELYHAVFNSTSVGVCSDASAALGSEMIFYGNGGVLVSSDERSAKSATVCSSELFNSWDCVAVASAETQTLSALLATGALAVTADEEAEYDITVSSFFNEIVFENFNGGAAGVTVTEDENGNAVIIYNENEEIAASQLFGNSLIFCTMGADPIETQSGIPMGGFATEPDDPERTGLIFGGWYTSYECTDGTEWSFDTPITEDTYIYAKWIVNDDYAHLVTFRIDGCDDVSYLVVDGEALTDYELPEIPEMEGHTAAWPEFDLSCITEDMVIEAIYTPIPYTVTFIGFDGEVLWEQTVDYGTAAEAPEPPEIEGHTFIGWDTDFSNITGDLIVFALYEINTYTVTFVDWDGTVIDEQIVPYGNAATAPDDPERPGWNFLCWDVDFSYVTYDLTVTALYEQNGPSVTLLGDVDLDGEVTAADALLAMRHAMSITTVSGQGFVNGDMDGDGLLTASDAILIMRAVMDS